jgi:Coenzyme PQQ synthesis protein D (PqqD)
MKTVSVAAADTVPRTPSLAESKVRIPQNVVYRRLPTETVVFNLQTGKYHGLNDTAGSMLEALTQSASVCEAASSVATEYGQSQERIEQDMRELCDGLLARGLIELDGDSSR